MNGGLGCAIILFYKLWYMTWYSTEHCLGDETISDTSFCLRGATVLNTVSNVLQIVELNIHGISPLGLKPVITDNPGCLVHYQELCKK